MRRSITALSGTFLVLLAGHVSAGPALAAVCDGSATSLGDGGFETPGAPLGYIALPLPDQMPPWQTTDSNFEIWGDGFMGVPAGEGGSFAEINANIAGTLYQDVVTTPGQTMHWRLLHRARVGTDVMQVLIGDANTADPNGGGGWDFISPDISDDTSAWGAHSGDFVVPAGQTCTRFAFRAVSSGAGDNSFGNFLDAVGFSIPVPPTPRPTRAPAPRPTIHITQPPTDTVVGQATPADAGGPLATALLMATAFAGAALGLARLRTARLRQRGIRSPRGRSGI